MGQEGSDLSLALGRGRGEIGGPGAEVKVSWAGQQALREQPLGQCSQMGCQED